jgi:hypothetical protein
LNDPSTLEKVMLFAFRFFPSNSQKREINLFDSFFRYASNKA